ncbi:hypothetical protein BDN70DRAFT_875388 [Pholiota conissans]|uniref:Tetraspanin n=1 Tax=Pholiota conissans TaxID=109636 RepID=A0A9P5Z8F3_9AGAR|nr:hypothetical protein BDN70DRAFT_875388 [Pholiota conissans]
MAAKFLCCLPLRFGVIVISFLQFFFSGALAGLLWWALIHASQQGDLGPLTQSAKTTVIVVGAVYTAAALVGLLGFLGAILRKNGFVKTFYILLCVVLSLEVGSSIWYLITFYRTRGQTLDECINGSTDSNRIAFCNSIDAYKRIPQGVMIASVVVPIVIQAYACYIVYQYSKFLDTQKAERRRMSSSFIPPSGPAYQPVMAQDNTYPFAQQYPYTDASHTFGRQPQRSVGGNGISDKV